MIEKQNYLFYPREQIRNRVPNKSVQHEVFPAIIRLTETSKLELSEIITGDLPPNSRVTGTKFSDAALITCLAIDVAPVKEDDQKVKKKKLHQYLGLQ